MKIGIKKNIISVGLKISDQEISALGFSETLGGQQKLVLDQLVSLPEGCVKNGRIIDEGKLLASLEIAFEQIRNEGDCFCAISFAIPENLLFYFNFEISTNVQNEKEFLEKELAKHSPLQLKETEYRYKIKKENEVKKFFVVAVQKKALKEWQGFFYNYSFPVENYCLEGVGDFFSKFSQATDKAIAIFHLNPCRANLYFFDKEDFVEASSHHYAQNDVIKNLQKIYPRLAEDLDMSGVQKDEKYFVQCDKIVKPILSRLENEIDIFQSKQKKEVDEVIVIGNLFERAEILKLFRESIAMPVKKPSFVFLDIKNSNEKSVAMGLGLWGLSSNRMKPGLSFSSDQRDKTTNFFVNYFKIKSYFFGLVKKQKLPFLLLIGSLCLAVLVTMIFLSKKEKQEKPSFSVIPQIEELQILKLGVLLDGQDEEWLSGEIIDFTIENPMPFEQLIEEARDGAKGKMKKNDVLFPYPINLRDFEKLIFPAQVKFLSIKKTDLNYFLKTRLDSETDFLQNYFRAIQVIESYNELIFYVEIEIKKHPDFSEEKIKNLEKGIGKLKIKDYFSGLNIRFGPGKNFQVIGSAKPGIEYFFTDEQENWVRILFDQNDFGWISNDFVERLELKDE